MKRPRVSMLGLMAVVAFAAADLAALRAILPMIPNPGFVVMVVVLEFGLFRLARRPRAFWVGFEVAGWAYVLVNGEWSYSIWRLSRSLYEAHVLGGPLNISRDGFRFVLLAGVVQLALSLAIALLGGLACRKLMARGATPPDTINEEIPCPGPSPSSSPSA